MCRRLISVLSFALVLVLASGAEAKGPPSGFQVCGQSACATITPADSEELGIELFYGQGTTELSTPTVPPAAFYALHWRFDGDLHTGYYVPLLNAFRFVGDPASPADDPTALVHWFKLDATARQALGQAVASLQPFPRPVPTRVTVGGKVVSDPESYLRLWSIGKATFRWPDGPFLRIAITTETPSPWSDRAAHLSIARRGSYLLRDATIMRIPAGLARQIRARTSLR
jgi:hypothetical protein